MHLERPQGWTISTWKLTYTQIPGVAASAKCVGVTPGLRCQHNNITRQGIVSVDDNAALCTPSSAIATSWNCNRDRP